VPWQRALALLPLPWMPASTEHLEIEFAGLRIVGHAHEEGGTKVVNLTVQKLPGQNVEVNVIRGGSCPRSAAASSASSAAPAPSVRSASPARSAADEQDSNSRAEVGPGSDTILPAGVAAEARRLRPLGGFSPRARLVRAYEAGRSAGKVLAGERRYPSATPKFAGKVDSSWYIVIPKNASEEPFVTRSWAEAKKKIGTRFGDEVVCHGFPSKSEAEAFAVGAGLSSLPEPSA